MDFSNKLEIKYTFNEKSNYLDAFIRNRCEKEILTMVRSLADMFDVRLMVYTEPTEMVDGYREIWSIAGEDARCISVIINMKSRISLRRVMRAVTTKYIGNGVSIWDLDSEQLR